MLQDKEYIVGSKPHTVVGRARESTVGEPKKESLVSSPEAPVQVKLSIISGNSEKTSISSHQSGTMAGAGEGERSMKCVCQSTAMHLVIKPGTDLNHEDQELGRKAPVTLTDLRNLQKIKVAVSHLCLPNLMQVLFWSTLICNLTAKRILGNVVLSLIKLTQHNLFSPSQPVISAYLF